MRTIRPSLLTTRDEFRWYETGEIRFLAIPEDPKFLRGSKGEGWWSGRGCDAQVEDTSSSCRGGCWARGGRCSGHPSPHAENVTREAPREARQYRVLEGSAPEIASHFAPHELLPFDAAEVRLQHSLISNIFGDLDDFFQSTWISLAHNFILLVTDSF